MRAPATDLPVEKHHKVFRWKDFYDEETETLKNINSPYPVKVRKKVHFLPALRFAWPELLFDYVSYLSLKLVELIYTSLLFIYQVINCIEQVICAGGRTFFGTKSSTFTSYIFRLRGKNKC